jgi:hypothetical protein
MRKIVNPCPNRPDVMLKAVLMLMKEAIALVELAND